MLVVLLAVLGVGLGLAVMWRARGSAGAADAQDPVWLGGVPQGHLYTGTAEEPEDVNPFTAAGNAARRLVLAYTHDALLDRDPATGALRPALAAAYERAPDGGSCTFTLRDDVRFADGSPLTMADVLFGWELAQAGHLPLGFVRAAYERVDRVDARDDRRFRVHFASAHYAALQVVGCAWLVANRRFFVERVRGQLDAGEALPAVDSARFAELLGRVDRECGPGTGPYVLYDEPDGRSTWRRRQELLLERNPHCWRRAAAPGSWNFAGMRVLFRDHDAAVNALLRGEVDWYSGPMVDDLLRADRDLARRYRKLVYDYDELGVFRIVWNCRRAPCDDVRVRRALGMLVDRQQILQLFGGAAVAAVAHARPATPGYPALDPPAFDPPAARRLLREAGHAPELDGALRLTLLAPNGETLRRIAELFQGAAVQAGIRLDVRLLEWPAFVAAKTQGDWDGMLAYQSFDAWGDPHRFLHGDGLDNDGGWRDADADRLAGAAQRELDPDRRAALWRELHAVADRGQPAAILVHPLASVLLGVHVEGVVVGPGGLGLERAWVAPEFQRR